MSRRAGRSVVKSSPVNVDHGAHEVRSPSAWTDWRPANRSRALLWLANGALLLWLALLLAMLVLRT